MISTKTLQLNGARCLTLMVILAASATGALAQSLPDDPVERAKTAKHADEAMKNFCAATPQIPVAPVFADVTAEALSIRKDYCDRKIGSNGRLQTRILATLVSLNAILPNAGGSILLGKAYKYFEASEGVPQFSVKGPVAGPLRLSVEDTYTLSAGAVKQCDDRVDQLVGADAARSWDCKAAIIQFKKAYEVAHGTLAQPLVFPVLEHLGNLEKKWDSFYEESRSQTILEMMVNGYFFQKNNQAHQFMEPPKRQIILLHPSLVIENVPDAIDGEQMNEALLFELIGMNWWQQDQWYIPSGASISAVYADHAAVEDWGIGLAVHFQNKFTLGVADHDGDESVFVSVDLLKLLQKKSTLLEEYRDSLDF